MAASVQILNFCAHNSVIRLHNKRQIVRVRCENREYNIDKKKNKLKILIAGGGIAGLVLALAAKRSGFEVMVFEKDLTAVRGEGKDRGPIQLLSSALGLLENVDKDVVREIREAGYVTGDRTNGLADGRTGTWFAKFDFLSPALKKGIPVTQIICRMELQRVLLNAVGEDLVVNNSRVVDFADDPNKVTVLLENGEKYEGDLLVGADGIRSMVRTKLFGPNKVPKYSNFICYTGVAESHPNLLPPFGYKIFIGRNQYFVALDIGKGRMQWYAFDKEARDSPIPSAGNKKQLLEYFGDWCDEVIRTILNTEECMIIRRPIHDIDMLNTWGKGRVILLGDAAHAMLPNLGQGGSMAIEDCYWLMVELRNLAERVNPFSAVSSDELAEAFRSRFEKKRMFRVSTVHSICRIASVLTSFYSSHFNVGPLPFFNLSALRVKHPSFVVSSTLLKFALPKFMDWVVVGQE
ncbi:zeaxanthin epoxidase chloroplastic [Phtheirospermum japonicum]|uniref:Zeaxanthin epoxidase chloroplastic n=1 Tax=Phtheirospermum japonicum TaxID=374723 RepID=A0A830D4H7_9LAMI|nr:zeaxanthin epoxidase chloroplastic [Phtheirospermum japonicum]